MIIKDLFSNLAILLAILFMYNQFTNKSPLNRKSTIRRKIIIGFLGGLLGNILMYYSMHIGDVIIDLRHIPIILLAFFAGAIPSYLAMTLIILGRFLIGINQAAFFAVPLMLFVTIGAVYFSRSHFSGKMKVILSIACNNILFSISLSYLIKDLGTLVVLIPVYWCISYLGGFVAFYIINYLRTSQMLFQKYKNESTIDGLTGLNNFRKFDEIFNSLLKKTEEKQEKLSLLYIDIDFFKKINDKYGHKHGDEVLRQLGEILQKCTKSFDIISRNGGEEFTVLLLDSSLQKALDVAENIRKSVEEYSFYLSGEEINITVSIGISCYNETTLKADNLLDDADKALYQAKNTGRNKVCVSKNNEWKYNLS